MKKAAGQKTPVTTVPLPSGRAMPMLGQGTWKMGEKRSERPDEIAALKLGIDLGMTLIDTAEMYGEGEAEKIVGEAVAKQRAKVFITSKVYPWNATKLGTLEACERSLERMKTDYIDLYLLHWREAEDDPPLEETLEAFLKLKKEGMILDYGVSNFDVNDMEEIEKFEGAGGIVNNQVEYNLMHRGIEYDLLPWCRKRKIPVTAYSPLDCGNVEERAALNQVALRHEVTAAQVALAWLLHQEVIVIPKAASPKHLRQNREAFDLKLRLEDLAELDRAYPPPKMKVPLQMK